MVWCLLQKLEKSVIKMTEVNFMNVFMHCTSDKHLKFPGCQCRSYAWAFREKKSEFIYRGFITKYLWSVLLRAVICPLGIRHTGITNRCCSGGFVANILKSLPKPRSADNENFVWGTGTLPHSVRIVNWLWSFICYYIARYTCTVNQCCHNVILSSFWCPDKCM